MCLVFLDAARLEVVPQLVSGAYGKRLAAVNPSQRGKRPPGRARSSTHGQARSLASNPLD
jgi:hypothetical protein